ncbi:CAP domain-containing protein [Vibrio alginolyticus]|uniref:CAP domain-containing protein n=1 Tax=Vibrio alginolyticus TaxID=663 RepID=UPI001BD6DB29|nr:CAP domain-containing protein [Vibrio alginolyticus]MBS9808494.1 CAP domain-containing protein [Vibrio alginolyticus]
MPTKILVPALALLLSACGGDGESSAPAESGSQNTGSTSSQGTFAEQMLAAVNSARSTTQQCGATTMLPVGALTWSYDLESAAYRHSSDMANSDFMSHTGSDGSKMSDRVNATGYAWSAIGENVAVGQSSINAVVNAWLSSEGHCLNIMSADFDQMGASLVENHSARYGYYWTQVFAKQR